MKLGRKEVKKGKKGMTKGKTGWPSNVSLVIISN